MGSGLIYAVIIAMWAAYFIPLLLRRHEQLSESRSVERFSRAMRILSRRPAPVERREVLMPRREGPRVEVSVKRRVVSEAARARQLRARALVRRRRILAVLLLGSLIMMAAAAAGRVSWWAAGISALLLVADLVHLRRTAAVAREVGRTRSAARRRAEARARRAAAAGKVARTRRVLSGEAEAAEAEAARLAAEDAARLEAERAEAAAGAWSPVPTHVPTYVTKPRAPGPERRLDLERILAEEEAVAPSRASMDPVIEHLAATAASHDEDDAELDAIINRAVNG